MSAATGLERVEHKLERSALRCYGCALGKAFAFGRNMIQKYGGPKGRTLDCVDGLYGFALKGDSD